jgi:glucosamine--fructose-6-phosphate aminotransferase (isomerizing)
MNNDAPFETDEKAIMLREIALQPEFVRASIAGVLSRAREALAAHSGRRLNTGIVIGCGDSYCAGLAARSYLSALTRRWVEPVEALEFSRYLLHDLPADAFVIGVSNSGTVARTVEGIRLARERGAWTFAVTVSAENPRARAEEPVVRIAAPPNIKTRADGSKLVTPGSITYTASLLGVYLAAVALGEYVGALSSQALRAAVAEFARVADWMAEADATVAALAPALAATFTRERTTVIVGGGPNLATAYFGAAKWFEALQWPAHHAQIEEWAHEHYFFTGPTTDTIVLLPPGGARERGLEQVRAAHEMGSRTIVVGETGDHAAQAAADVFIAMPLGIPEALTPFVYKLPLEYVAAHIAQQNGIDFFGFSNSLRQQVNFRQIFDSSQTPAAPR